MDTFVNETLLASLGTGGNLISIAQVFAALITAFATIALWRVTKVLAAETRNLAVADSPFVVATIEPSQWSIVHVELMVENTGKSTAFNIEILSDLELPAEEQSRDREVPFQNINALRPGQRLRSFIGDFQHFRDCVVTFEITWSNRPNGNDRQSLRYEFNLAHLRNVVVRLGATSPEHQIAEEIKHIRNDWRAVAQGQRRLKVDAYDDEVRRREAEERRAVLDEMRARQNSASDDGSQD